MHHEFCKNPCSAVWATKYRSPILTREKREVLFEHIYENARNKNIHIMSLGGHIDHVHCLFSMTKDETIGKTIQLIKGESSNWANKRNLFPGKLIWAEDYFAASISEGAIKKVRHYIENQEEHHSNMSVEEEDKKFKIAHGFVEYCDFVLAYSFFETSSRAGVETKLITPSA